MASSNPPEGERSAWPSTLRPVQNGVESPDSAMARFRRRVPKLYFNEDGTIDVDAKNDTGETALHKASFLGYEDIVTELLSRNADVNATSEDGRTPLHHALGAGSQTIAIQLINAGCDVNAKAPIGFTALHFASSFGCAEAVKLLLEKGVEINARSVDNGFTPLFYAIFTANLEIAKLLIEDNRCDVNVASHSGQTPLMEAAGDHLADIVKLILSRDDSLPNTLDPEGFTPLFRACRCGDCSVVELLLRKGAKIGPGREHPLIHAVKYSEFAMVNVLLQHETESNRLAELDQLVDDAGCTLLMLACRYSSLEMVKAIWGNRETRLDYINKKDKEKWTALHHAIASAKPANIVEFLFENGAKFDTRDSDVTPLGLMIKMLLTTKNSMQLPSKDPPQLGDVSATTAFLVTKTSLSERRVAILHIPRESQLDEYQALLRLDEDDKLPWYAKHHMHAKLADLLRAKHPKPSNHESRTVLDLAAFHGLHLAVFLLMGTGVFTGADLENAVALVEEERGKIKDSLVQTIEEMRNDSKISAKKIQISFLAQLPKDDYRSMLRVLKEGQYRMSLGSHLELQFDRYLKGNNQWKAILVDFYRQQDGLVEILECSRDISKLLYNRNPLPGENGPNGVMSEMPAKVDLTTKEIKNDEPEIRWIHLPATNMKWLEDTAQIVHRDNNQSDPEYNEGFFQGSWHELDNGFGSKFMKPSCKEQHDQKSRVSKKGPGKQIIKQNVSDEGILGNRAGERPGNKCQTIALYIPYLAFGKASWKRRTEPQISQQSQTSLPISRTSQQPKAPQQHLERYKELLQRCQAVQGTRSLDRFYHKSLIKDEETQNQDQVVGRPVVNALKHVEGGITENAWIPMINVDQLWLWVINEQTVITCATHRIDESRDPIHKTILDQLKRDQKEGSARRAFPSTPEELGVYITQGCVEFINTATLKQSELDLDVPPELEVEEFWENFLVKSMMDIFRDTITQKEQEEQELFTDFIGKINKEIEKTKNDIEFPKKEINNMEKDEQAKRTQELKDWESIKQAAVLLHEIKDIREELSMLRLLVVQQRSVLKSLTDALQDGRDMGRPDQIISEIDEMCKMVERIQKSILDLLALEQSSINITEAIQAHRQTNESIKQGKQAAKQVNATAEHGKTLMVFTIVTTVFAPMSFLTSLFALNVDSFQRNSQGELRYTGPWVFSRIFGISVAIIVGIVAFALRKDMTKKVKQFFDDNLTSWSSHQSKNKSNLATEAETQVQPSEQHIKAQNFDELKYYLRKIVNARSSEAAGSAEEGKAGIPYQVDTRVH